MNRIARFVIWICSKFNRQEIEQIISGLLEVLANRNPEVKPRDDFKEKHPNYRNFSVDPEPPLTEPLSTKPKANWKDLLLLYQQQHGHPLKGVKRHGKKSLVPEKVTCLSCQAPSEYLYFNDGSKRTQLLCKVCHGLFQLQRRYKKAKYYCPHCGWALLLWKQSKEMTTYKCCNDNCPVYLRALEKLNEREKKLQKKKPSQFKLRYQYREYHFKREQLEHSSPDLPLVDLARIHRSDNVLGLVLAFHISFGLAARKTAFILRQIFQIRISYQTVLNYSQATAFHCHRFNLQNKGPVDPLQAGDETYIKISGQNAYTFFFISVKNHKITAYHLADNRGTLPAAVAINEATGTCTPDQNIELVTDGNPSYQAALHFINSERKKENLPPIKLHQVIGLQNLDSESKEYRPFKQIIERLNRTYKFHTRSAHGFSAQNGARSLTTLFVTHLNFLRPHWALDGKVPIPIPELARIPTLQAKWCKIIDMACQLTWAWTATTEFCLA
jgi:transposase-like protein